MFHSREVESEDLRQRFTRRRDVLRSFATVGHRRMRGRRSPQVDKGVGYGDARSQHRRCRQLRQYVDQESSGNAAKKLIPGPCAHALEVLTESDPCGDRPGHRRPRLHLPVITFAEPDPYLLAESEERPTQQGDRESKKDTGSVYMLPPEERAPKSHDKEQRRAHSADNGQVCCAVQKCG